MGAAKYWAGRYVSICNYLSRTQREMDPQEVMVYIVEDNLSIRKGLDSLIRSEGMSVQTFGSADEFMQSTLDDVPRCLILDIRLPGLSGLDLQRELARMGTEIPIIFISAYGDIPM